MSTDLRLMTSDASLYPLGNSFFKSKYNWQSGKLKNIDVASSKYTSC